MRTRRRQEDYSATRSSFRRCWLRVFDIDRVGVRQVGAALLEVVVVGVVVVVFGVRENTNFYSPLGSNVAQLSSLFMIASSDVARDLATAN